MQRGFFFYLLSPPCSHAAMSFRPLRTLDSAVSKATSSDIASAIYRFSGNKGVRSLRTSETDKDLTDEERGNNFYDDMATWLSSLSEQVVIKAETSPKVLKWFTRSKSIKQLAETKSLTLEALQRSLIEKYTALESALKTPDDLFTMLKLNPEVAAIKKFDHKVLRKVSDDD